MCGSHHLPDSFYMWLQVWIWSLTYWMCLMLSLTQEMSWRCHEPLIRKLGCQSCGTTQCMFLWYIKSFGSHSSNHPHSPSAFLSGLHCPIKKIWGLETAGAKEGFFFLLCEWEKESFVWEHIITSYCVQFVSCRFLPVKSDDINEKIKLRANAQHRLDVGSAVCVSVC